MYTPSFNDTVQYAVDVVYLEVEYEVQMGGDPIHLMVRTTCSS